MIECPICGYPLTDDEAEHINENLTYIASKLGCDHCKYYELAGADEPCNTCDYSNCNWELRI